jgi:4-alpha-glucanotransferase
MGDLGDLARLNRWSAGLGAGAVLVNPLHANAPGEPQQPSPYFATSRLWRNPAYLDVPRLPGIDELGDQLTALDELGRALPTSTIDRDAVMQLKHRALAALFERFEQSPGRQRPFVAWRTEQGVALERFAIWSALAERHGPAFGSWPSELRHPDSAAVASFAALASRAVTFHAWCQWLVDLQLADARVAGVQLIGDLAVGFDARGADAWANQDILALGCRVGAPPDAFNANGQDWGLPPFVPWKLREARYEPFAASLRASFGHLDGLRIDHVMGLFRLYWLPEGRGPKHGAYVRYPAADLLDIVAIEATRAGAFVIGEDLGTVEEHVGRMLRERAVLGCRVFWFEDHPPADYPDDVLASVSTHDLPTVAGVWTGADEEEQRSIGLPTEGDEPQRARLREHAGVADGASAQEVIVAVHHALGAAPSVIALASLDDALGVERRPNLPGTVDERPNWRLPLPQPLEVVEHDALVASVAEALRAGRAERAADTDQK